MTVVWHSIVGSYVDPEERRQVERITTRPGMWRMSYEPDAEPHSRGIPLRLRGPGATAHPDGQVLAFGTGHGPPLPPP